MSTSEGAGASSSDKAMATGVVTQKAAHPHGKCAAPETPPEKKSANASTLDKQESARSLLDRSGIDWKKPLTAETIKSLKPLKTDKTSSGFVGVYKGRGDRYQAQIFHTAIGGYATAEEAGRGVTQHLIVVAQSGWVDVLQVQRVGRNHSKTVRNDISVQKDISTVPKKTSRALESLPGHREPFEDGRARGQTVFMASVVAATSSGADPAAAKRREAAKADADPAAAKGREAAKADANWRRRMEKAAAAKAKAGKVLTEGELVAANKQAPTTTRCLACPPYKRHVAHTFAWPCCRCDQMKALPSQKRPRLTVADDETPVGPKKKKAKSVGAAVDANTRHGAAAVTSDDGETKRQRKILLPKGWTAELKGQRRTQGTSSGGRHNYYYGPAGEKETTLAAVWKVISRNRTLEIADGSQMMILMMMACSSAQ